MHNKPGRLQVTALNTSAWDVVAAQAEGRNTLAGGPEVPVDHPAGCLSVKICGNLKGRQGRQKFTSFHAR